MANDHNKDRADRRANEPRKKNKSDRQREMVERMAKNAGVDNPANPGEDQTAQTPAPEIRAEDQKPADTPAADTPKKKKKLSKTVIDWRAMDDVPEDKIVHIVPGAKKTRGAQDRFALYVDGMSVKDYVQKSKDAGYGAAQAKADVRWDVVKGLITVS